MNKLIISGLLAFFPIAPAYALFGVGDVVIVASNPAQEMLWAAKELPKWIEMIDKAQEQVNKAQQMINIVGNPEQFATGIIAESLPNFSITEDANQLQAREALLDFTRASWTLHNSTGKLKKGALKVDEKYKAFGRTLKRDRDKYVLLAMEKALHARVQEAAEKKHEVDKKELAFQQQTMGRLAAAGTQTEITLHQAAIAASQQRMELAEARFTQAQEELRVFKGEVEIDQSKRVMEAREWADAVMSEARNIADKARMAGGGQVDPAMVPADWGRGSF